MAGWAALAVLFIAFALLRPVDHDESQYVAATVLTAHGLLPYRDFAYLQTPLQPFLFAPIAWAAGPWTWPALRIANALLGLAAVGFVHTALRAAGVRPATALAVAALFASCDILLFGIGTARNDALPAALLAAAIWGHARGNAPLLIGACLAAAAAAKISYALPAAAYGLYALTHRGHRWPLVALGAAPVLAFVAGTYALSAEGFLFGTVHFPARAPAEFYASRPWKLSWAAKAVDTLKFLALGTALPALFVVARAAWARRKAGVYDWLIVAGAVAALLPFPTWRQYLLPVLSPLFVGLGLAWAERPPTRRTAMLFATFALIGVIPSIVAVAESGRLSLAAALREGRAVKRTLDANALPGPIATLSPEILPMTGRLPDPRFAAGPFYFRSHGLLDPAAERRLHLMSRDRAGFAPGTVILTGGESEATAGDPALDAAMARGRRIRVSDRFSLYVTSASPPPVRHNSP
ncbi:DUF2029 domain-containing protein [Sphingomonas sp. PB2P19]|uniref:DUF2029 domain-containing protein n=1 Tax=Sphingomonas rhamnosi TaxID=3096156 RepID=UPI002FC9CCD5